MCIHRFVQGTFQQDNKRFFMISSVFGFYWPGVEEVMSPSMAWVFYIYCSMVTALPIINVIAVGCSVIIYPLPLPVFVLILRRCVGMVQMLFKLIGHAVPSRRRMLNKLFYVWNYDINTMTDRPKRQELLKEEQKTVLRIFAFVVIFGVFLLAVPTFLLFFNRNMRGGAYTYLPHDVNAWYHFYFVALQLTTFLVSNMAGQSFNYLTITLLAMGGAQLDLLRINLEKICASFDGFQSVVDKNQLEETHREIRAWVKAHQNTLRWLTDLRGFLGYTATVKFIFIGSYVCLSVFTLPNYLKSGSSVDIMLVSFYVTSSFAFNLYECRLTDALFEKSGAIFKDAYTSFWFLYPRSVTQDFSIIQTRSICRPIRVKAFSIAPDNSATFLAVPSLITGVTLYKLPL